MKALDGRFVFNVILLEQLLAACKEYKDEWDIFLNANKSKLMYFGKECSNLFVAILNGRRLEWVNSWNHLMSGKHFSCSATEPIKKVLQICQRHILIF